MNCKQIRILTALLACTALDYTFKPYSFTLLRIKTARTNS